MLAGLLVYGLSVKRYQGLAKGSDSDRSLIIGLRHKRRVPAKARRLSGNSKKAHVAARLGQAIGTSPVIIDAASQGVKFVGHCACAHFVERDNPVTLAVTLD
jgi:hypothetical protein